VSNNDLICTVVTQVCTNVPHKGITAIAGRGNATAELNCNRGLTKAKLSNCPRSETRILLKEGVENEKFLWRYSDDVFSLLAYSLWRHWNVIFEVFYCVIVRHRIYQNYPIFHFFLNFDLAAVGPSAPLALPLIAPLLSVDSPTNRKNGLKGIPDPLI